MQWRYFGKVTLDAYNSNPLLNAPGLHAKLTHDAGTVARLVRRIPDDSALAVELYLTFFSRFPTEEERVVAMSHLALDPARRRQAAEDVLRAAAGKNAAADQRQRVEQLLARLHPEARTPERLQAVRAVEVLERIATPAARRLLAELLEHVDDPRVADEVRDSLARLKE